MALPSPKRSRSLKAPLSCLLALAILSGCEGPPQHPSRVGIDTLPNGVVRIQNSELGAWDSGGEWRLRETLRLGTRMGNGPEVFGRIQDIEIDPMGRLWIFEAQTEEMRVFSAEGDFVRTFGRPGEGPGEFGNVLWACLGSR